MRAVPWVLAVLLGVSIAAAALLKVDLDAERARSAALEARVQALERDADARTAPPGPARPVAAASTARPASPPALTPMRPEAEVGGLVTPPRPDIAAVRASRERQRALWRDPEYRAAMLEQHKTALRRRYGDAAQEFGLTASEMDRLLEVLAVAQLPDAEMADLGAGVRGDGAPDPAQMRKLRERMMERQRTQEAELRTLLGDARYAQWQDFDRSTPTRMQAAQVRTDLAAAGVPIDADQTRALARLLAEEQRRAQEDFRALDVAMPFATVRTTQGAASTGVAVPTAPPTAEERLRHQRALLELAERTNARLRDAASAVLTAEQLEIFMQPKVTGVAEQRARLRLRETSAGADAGRTDIGR